MRGGIKNALLEGYVSWEKMGRPEEIGTKQNAQDGGYSRTVDKKGQPCIRSRMAMMDSPQIRQDSIQEINHLQTAKCLPMQIETQGRE